MTDFYLNNLTLQLNMLKNVKIPKLHVDSKKGDFGRIAIVGGSKEYTGAPYFSAISALRTGADLCHIICSNEAAIPLKV